MKLRSSGPLLEVLMLSATLRNSKVLIFTIMVKFELDLYILIPSQSNY